MDHSSNTYRNNPLVSIVIPAYKAEKYIEYALESVRYQTYLNWELIVVEDGWRDQTEEIVNEFSKSVPSNKILFIRHTLNRGLGATRNTAIKSASGTYIALLDHDDVWKSDHLQKSILSLENNQVDLTYSNVILIDEKGSECGNLKPTQEEIVNFPASLYNRNYIVPSSTVFKKGSLERIGLFVENLRYHGCEDYACWIKMIRSGSQFLYLDNSSCFYRQHQEQLTFNMDKMLESVINVLQENKDWQIISKNVRSKRLFKIYYNLAKLSWKKNKGKSIKLYMHAWMIYPFDFFYHARKLALLF